MVNGMYALINGAIIVDKIVIIAQEAEPAVPANKFRIWHDTTAEAERRWLVLGTDGTVEGNTKVEIS
ncbi:hypothetical protein ES703_96002 [subsurface metagenome]